MSVATCSLCVNLQQQVAEDRCASCLQMVCCNCVQHHIPNRHHAVLCKRCVFRREAFSCGRCGGAIPFSSFTFFCALCAVPMCTRCLMFSFEGGQLKCARCCDQPVVSLVRQRGVPTALSEELIASLASTSSPTAPLAGSPIPRSMTPPPPSVYRTLLDKKELGAGAQGVVFKCRTPDGQIVVSKEMNFLDTEKDVFESQLRQALRMRRLSHRHLIKYLDVYPSYNPPRIHVIMPYYDAGDLGKFISNQRGPVKEYKLCSIVLQIATALQYLHSQKPPLVHRDIKPDNILLDNKDEVLLMDLDLCQSVDITASVVKVRDTSPTYEYKAPELEHCSGNGKSDVFSLGVVMFLLSTLPDFAWLTAPSGTKMVLGAHEWSPAALETALREAVRRVRNYSYSSGFIDLLVSMLRHDPQRRPTSAEVSAALPIIMENALMGRNV